jgi:RNA recognition motif-containing protein
MANPKRTVYVGGLAEEVDEKTLQAAFIPFGMIKFFFRRKFLIVFFVKVISSKFNYQLIMKLKNIVVLHLLNTKQLMMLQQLLII